MAGLHVGCLRRALFALPELRHERQFALEGITLANGIRWRKRRRGFCRGGRESKGGLVVGCLLAIVEAQELHGFYLRLDLRAIFADIGPNMKRKLRPLALFGVLCAPRCVRRDNAGKGVRPVVQLTSQPKDGNL
jgi:hypothetical protein